MGCGAIVRLTASSEVELIEVDELGDPPERRTAVGLQVHEHEVDKIYRRLEEAGARLKAPPRLRPWGMRGFGAFDPSGVPVNIYAPAAARIDQP